MATAGIGKIIRSPPVKVLLFWNNHHFCLPVLHHFWHPMLRELHKALNGSDIHAALRVAMHAERYIERTLKKR